MIRWFGKDWGAPVNAGCEHVAAPIGQPCERCKVPIADADCGFLLPCLALTGTYQGAYHLACFLRACGIRRAPEEAPAA
jgi:hypothetical protein